MFMFLLFFNVCFLVVNMCPLKFCTLDCSHLVGSHPVLQLAVTGTNQNIRICDDMCSFKNGSDG